MNSLKGHLLIAAPTLITPFFTKTVILMLEHSEEGAMGVVLNRPTETTVEEIAEQTLGDPQAWDKPIYLGGPVPGPLMALHTNELWSDQEVIPGVHTAIEASKVREIIQTQSEPSLIIANYSGWGPGQLEDEFTVDSWITLPAKLEHVFQVSSADELWQQVVKQVGARKLSEFLNLREIPPDPSLN